MSGRGVGSRSVRPVGTLADDVARGLGTRPLRLPPKWLYDDAGSELFDQITRLADYYPTEAERTILRLRGADIAAACDATTVIELGSGTSDKTRTLLDAFDARPAAEEEPASGSRSGSGRLRRFVPVDVSAGTLQAAAQMLSERYPGLAVEPVVGDFTSHLADLRTVSAGERRLVAFLGGTIGNLYLEERRAFLGALADSLDAGDWLLLGTDLVKEVDRLVAAYDDPGGVTAAFVSNILTVLNRELGADFDLAAFSYVPLWDARLERMDLRLRADMPQRVTIPGADLVLELGLGEELRVEVCTKFRPAGIAAELAGAGFGVVETFTDPAGDFALTLARLDAA